MARMSLDDFFLIDGRVDLLARQMEKDRPYAENALLRVWAFCYKEKRYILTRKEIATQSTWGAKFIDWLLECGLGRKHDYEMQPLDDDHVLLAGVKDRIDYLLRFSRAGDASAESRRAKSGTAQPGRSNKSRKPAERRSDNDRTSFDTEGVRRDSRTGSEHEAEQSSNDVRTSFDDCSNVDSNGSEPISSSVSIAVSTSSSSPVTAPFKLDRATKDNCWLSAVMIADSAIGALLAQDGPETAEARIGEVGWPILMRKYGGSWRAFCSMFDNAFRGNRATTFEDKLRDSIDVELRMREMQALQLARNKSPPDDTVEALN